MLETLTTKLGASQALLDEEVSLAVHHLVDEHVPTETKAEFLSALTAKGETVEEIAAFARELRARSVPPPITSNSRAGEILDVCGTGGDRLNTFNISTTVALVAAAAGIRVAKHGNRAITSQSGSADVLEALGVPIELSPTQAAESLEEHCFAFFFAPKYHPAFKHIAPARKICAAKGCRTIFNFLGPLLNPALPTVQLIGVPRNDWCEPVARVLASLGVRGGQVVCGKTSDGLLDELSILGENTIAEFYPGAPLKISVNPPPAVAARAAQAQLRDLQGGNARDNAEIIRAIFAGKERGPKRDAVLLNAAAAFLVCGKATSWDEGWELARETVDSGRAAAKLKELANHRYEPDPS